jgi:flagellar assembly protein FliH
MSLAGAQEEGAASVHWEVFAYPADPNAPPDPVWPTWMEGLETRQPGSALRAEPGNEAVLRGEFDKRLAEETRKSFEAGRDRGRQEGRQAEHEKEAAASADAENRRARQASELVQICARERDRFFEDIEHEVVSLALAVAARILRREAQMDPLLLTGAVRVALGQLAEKTEVRLLVPAGELDLWAEAMAVIPNLAVRPAVLAGRDMRTGECVLETQLGSVDLGIRAQLGEIERGFFDRGGGRRAVDGPQASLPAAEARS